MNTVARTDDPRATFDRLAWVLAAVALVLVPHAVRMPAWITLFFGVMAAWRLAGARRGWGMAPAWLRIAGALLGVIAIGVEYRAYTGQDAGLAMIVVLLSLKLTETVSRRDCIVLLFIGYMLVIGNFLYSQTMLTGVYMLIAVWFITMTLLSLTHPTTGIPLDERARTAGTLLLQALPLMVVMFFLFPRVPGPLWGVPEGQQPVTGISDSMEPGSIAELGQSNAIAFRVHFDDTVPSYHQLYWRGPVLRNFDGRRWTVGTNPVTDFIEYEALVEPVHYEVILEPHRRNWMFALDLPAAVPDDAAVTNAWQLLSREPVRDRVRYRMHSHSEYRTGYESSSYEVLRTLALPGGNERARALAHDWRETHGSPRAIIDAALATFREQEFWYTLSPPLLGAEAVDEFLFESRRGFCEHYAGSFAYLMRAAGIPARVILGYHGGEYNPVGDYLIVRQSDAHAWVEVLLDDEGWVRVDPTAAVAPDRIELGLQALDGIDGRGVGTLRGMALVNRLWLHWDDLNNSWNMFVLGFDRDEQRRFAARLGLHDAGYGTLVAAMTVVLGVLLALLSAWLLWQQRPVSVRDPALRMYAKFERALTAMGVAPRHPSEGPDTYRDRARRAASSAADEIDAFMYAYLRHRYHPGGGDSHLDAMRRALREIPH